MVSEWVAIVLAQLFLMVSCFAPEGERRRIALFAGVGWTATALIIDVLR